MTARDRAKKTLVYYLRTLYERAGLPWTSDNEAEVGGVVDDVVQAAIEP